STTIGDVSTGGGGGGGGGVGGGGGGGGVSLTLEPPPPHAESASTRHATRYFDIAFPMHFGRQRSVLGARTAGAGRPHDRGCSLAQGRHRRARKNPAQGGVFRFVTRSRLPPLPDGSEA